MPDDQNKDQAAGAGVNNAGAGEGQNTSTDQNKDAGATKTGNEDAGNSEGTDGGEGAKDTSKEGKDNAKAPIVDPLKKEGENENEDDGVDPEVRPRLSTQDFIIGRQHRKLASKKGEGAGENKDDKGDEAGNENSEVAPEDVKLITDVVSPLIAPLVDKSLAAEDDKEIADFLTVNPDFKPFEAKARRYMKHPSRRNLPVKSIFYEVAGDRLIKIGADRQKAADAKANNTQTGGGSNRAGEGAKSDWDLPAEEFAAKQERIRQGK